MMSKQEIAGLTVVFALLVVPVTATAETPLLPADAQQALDKGLAAAKQQQWEIAIQNFQDARKIAPDAPEIYYDLGLAESRIAGRELRSVSWFGAYLAASPDAPNAAAVKNFIAALRIKVKGNIDTLIKAAEFADNALPDTPIRHDGGITGKFTNKPDQDRIMSLYRVATLWASAGNSANAIEIAHRIGRAGYNETSSLSEIVTQQASSGYIDDAIKTAASFNDSVFSNVANLAIAAAQAKAGDLTSARATLMTAQARLSKEKSGYLRNSLGIDIARAQANVGDFSAAEKTVEMMPGPAAKAHAHLAIAEAQIKAGDVAAAQARLGLAQKAADLWNSLTPAQKKTACNCGLSEPQDQSTLSYLEQRIAKMRIDAGDVTGARSALRIAQKYARLIVSDQKNMQASNIAEQQARAGDIAGAQETARLISDKADKVWKVAAARAIVVAQAKIGDFAGAQKTADATGDPVETNMAKSVIATAQTNRASSTQATTPQPTPPQQAAAGTPALPPISAADWTRELDALNTPFFLDLPGSVKAPQQTYKLMYPGHYYDPKETDTKRTFNALVDFALNIISANSTVDEMLKRQFGGAKP
jgi:tetratricopeptide (TPR) repeat protein